MHLSFLDCAAQICCHQTSLFSALQMFLQEDLSWSGLTGQLSKNAVTKASQEVLLSVHVFIDVRTRLCTFIDLSLYHRFYYFHDMIKFRCD